MKEKWLIQHSWHILPFPGQLADNHKVEWSTDAGWGTGTDGEIQMLD